MLSGQDQPTLGESLNIIEPHNALALRLKHKEDGHRVPAYYPSLPSGFQMLEMLDNQIAALKPEAVILCSEVFALFGLTEKRISIRRLANRFAKHDVTIYCNLRRPDEHISSWHRQRLKFGVKLDRLADEGLQEYLGSAHFDQAKMIEGWIQDCFPEARLVVRNFDQVKASGGSIVDFMQNAGLAFPPDLRIPRDQNPSVPSAFAEIGRRAIHELDRSLSREVVQWLVTVKKRVNCPDDSQIEVFGKRNRDLLAQKFADVATSLETLTGQVPFYPNLQEFGIPRPVNDLQATKEALPALIEDAKNQNLSTEIADWLKS